tara:strand:+ start:1684 stop:1944 length:261 start_codon:yes stop_codon:yes gene_type:complete
MISFEIDGSKEDAFKFLNNVKVFKLAVSLGAIESLIQHPASMTHSDISREEQLRMGISESLLRCSVGLEDSNDLIEDLKNSFDILV